MPPAYTTFHLDVTAPVYCHLCMLCTAKPKSWTLPNSATVLCGVREYISGSSKFPLMVLLCIL